MKSPKEYSVELTLMLNRIKADKPTTIKALKELSQDERSIYLEELNTLSKRLQKQLQKLINKED